MAKQIKLSKNTKQLLIGGLIVLIVVLIIRSYIKSGEQQEISASTGSDGKPTSSSTGSSTPSWQVKYNALPELGENYWLKKGMKSKEIWQAQYLYNENIAKREGKSRISVDGIFGNQTEGAFKYVTQSPANTYKKFKFLVQKTKAERAAYWADKITGSLPNL